MSTTVIAILVVVAILGVGLVVWLSSRSSSPTSSSSSSRSSGGGSSIADAISSFGGAGVGLAAGIAELADSGGSTQSAASAGSV